MAACIPKEFQDEGRRLARLLLDLLGKAAQDLAAADIAQLSIAERRRWAVDTVRMARLLVTAFPPQVFPPDAGPRPSPRRKAKAKAESNTPTGGDKAASESDIGRAAPAAPTPPRSSPSALFSHGDVRPTLATKDARRQTPNPPGRFIFRSPGAPLAPARAAALADRILGPDDGLAAFAPKTAITGRNVASH